MRRTIIINTAALILFSCAKNEMVMPIQEIPDSGLKYAQSSDIVINELCTSNSGIKDESDRDPDWIEIYNKADSAVNLSGYGLSDDSSDIFKWRFGDVTMEPHQYLLVFASDCNISEVKKKETDDTIKCYEPSRWTDAEVGGRSSITPNEFKPAYWLKDEQGRRMISAIINVVNNNPDLEWSAANLTMGISRQKMEYGKDYSMYNQVELLMTLEKNKRLRIRLLQGGILGVGGDLVDWRCPYFIITGTGKKDDSYLLPLIHGYKGLDIHKINGFTIEATGTEYTSIPFTLKRVRFLHTGYNLHTNFKLSGGEKRLYLTRPDSLVLDTVPVTKIPVDMSMGKIQNKWVLLKQSTPGMENVQEYYTSISKMPDIVTKGGFYDSSILVTITATDSGEIHYTTDGSLPTITSRKYTGPIQIDSTTVLRSVSIKDGRANSKITTETYFIKESTGLPVVSVVADPGGLFDSDTGIYMPGPNADSSQPHYGANYWLDKEIPGQIQFFETNKKSQFSSDIGISIMGNWSRANEKKSLAINFRERYGQSELDYPLFSQTPNVRKFKRFVLRNNGGNYGRAMIEDPMMQSLIDDRNIDYQKYRPVVVFINGKYYGLHQLMEPANTDYIYSNYGLKSEQIDFYDAAEGMKQGTPENWNLVNSYLATSIGKEDGSLKDSAVDYVNKHVDLYNYIDYMAFEIYINNTDWPANNCRWWRDRSNGRWRWLIFDTDFGFGSIGASAESGKVSYNTLEFVLSESNPTGDEYPNGYLWSFLLRTLLKNEKFKGDFVNRFATLMSTNFEPDRVKTRIDQMANEIKDEIDRDFDRWGLTPSRWSSAVNKLKSFAENRPAYMYSFLRERFGASGTYNLTVECENGSVYINGMAVKSSSFTGKYFTGIPVKITIIPSKGRQFKKWSDGSTESIKMINSDKNISLKAICE